MGPKEVLNECIVVVDVVVIIVVIVVAVAVIVVVIVAVVVVVVFIVALEYSPFSMYASGVATPLTSMAQQSRQRSGFRRVQPLAPRGDIHSRRVRPPVTRKQSVDRFIPGIRGDLEVEVPPMTQNFVGLRFLDGHGVPFANLAEPFPIVYILEI